MRLLDEIILRHRDAERRLALYQGDVTKMRLDPVDVLVISAFPDDYVKTPSSVIGALGRRGIDVEVLARSKAIDWRASHSCWLSEDLGSAGSRLGFSRILCFEPTDRAPLEVMQDIFRALVPLASEEDVPVNRVAMPIVTAGDQGYGVDVVMPLLVEAAVNWLSLGLAVDDIRIVAYGDSDAEEARTCFTRAKESVRTKLPRAKKKSYDVFISYSHKEKEAATLIANYLRERAVRVFFDSVSLKPGSVWQADLFKALDKCNKAITLLSPNYLKSKACLDEFMIAFQRRWDGEGDILLPVYIKTTKLPGYMKLLQHIDCREGRPEDVRGGLPTLEKAVIRPVRPARHT